MLTLLSFLVLLAQATFVTSPENCLTQKKYPCAVLTRGKTAIAHADNSFYTSGNSVMTFFGPQDFFIVRGDFWITAKNPLQLKTTFAKWTAHSTKSEFWITAAAEKHQLKNFEGVIDVTPLGGEVQEVLSGRQVHVSSVDYSQRSCYVSNVSVIDFQEHVRSYGNVFPFGFLSVEEHLQKVAGAVLMASSLESLVLKKHVIRQLASHQEASARQRLEAIEAHRRDKYLRELFRVKSNFEHE